MIHMKVLFALIATFALSAGAATLNKDYSSVRVSGKYLELIDMGLQFDEYTAEFDVKSGKVKKIILRLDKDSISTGREETDKYISSKVLSVPSMKITLTSISSKQARGKIFVNGVLKNVAFTVKNVKTIPDPNSTLNKKLLTFQAYALIRRKDFNLSDAGKEDSLSSSVKLELNLVAQI